MAIDWNTVILALSNIGGIAILVRKYALSVDEHNKAMPAILESIKTIAASQEKTAAHLDELYNGRNDLVKRITVVETVHSVRGCNLPEKP